MPRIYRSKQLIRLAFHVLVLLTIIPACTPGSIFLFPESTSTPPTPTASPALLAEIVFRVQIPFNTPADRPVYLEMVDEVTGLGLNPLRYQMEPQSPNHHSIRLPIPIGSVMKYRYVLGTTPLALENTASGSSVRYRIFPVEGPDMVQDVVAAWNGMPYAGETGRIFGRAVDRISGNPAADLLLTAGGVQTISAGDGSFLLDGLPQGTHHLTAYSINGKYLVYEQGALVSSGLATQAEIHVTPAQFVSVTFIVNIPKLPVGIAQIRMIGNLYSLGNTYADLGGGINTLASRAPLLTEYDDGRYQIKLHLPVGFDLRYKYSLGDGFWNAEHEAGKFQVRQLIVPAEDTVIEDSVETWSSGDAAPIVFIARTPTNTPNDDVISIQFNPYSWLEPIPMWRAGPNEWIFILNSPLELLSDVGYRYCRNGYCLDSDDSEQNSFSGTFTKSSVVQYYQDQIDRWPYLSDEKAVTVVPSGQIESRDASFRVGIEYDPIFHPGWSAYRDVGLANVKALESNLLVLTPTWTFTQQNPPVIKAVPGKDGLWTDWIAAAASARDLELPLAIYPTPDLGPDIASWWDGTERSLSWWYSWYDRYETFILHNAWLAQETGAAALILGGPEIAPSYPNGTLPDGSPTDVPAEALERWNEIISEVRKIYQGQLFLALSYDGSVLSPPPFTSSFDQIYLLWSAQLTESDETQPFEAASVISDLLERDVRPLWMNTGKPVVLAVKFCSSTGQSCSPLRSSSSDYASSIDLQEQVDLYNAALSVGSSKEWLDGFVSRGYFSLVSQEDGSASVYGKPAWNALWYWYPSLVKDQ
jgi:hypothetical protein